MAKADKEEREDAREEEVDADHSEPRVYELGFHIDGELPDAEAKKIYTSLREKIAEVGEVVAEGIPQKVQLAYTVSRMEHGGRRDFNVSFFAWIAYEADGKGHEAVGEAVRATLPVFRFLDIKTTKEGAKHSAEMQEIFLKNAQENPPEEEVSDTELDAALKEVGV